jgi:hypothetical protein
MQDNESPSRETSQDRQSKPPGCSPLESKIPGPPPSQFPPLNPRVSEHDVHDPLPGERRI